MDRQLGACTLIWLDIREPNLNEHKSYTNKCEWSDMRIGLQLRKQLTFVNEKTLRKFGGEL